ncbi:MAG: class I SAM-dependent methyltransferase [Oligoflexia bacterium]|nr:class I SAM-dependent methyltransferase [Oligoflexia bacterium]
MNIVNKEIEDYCRKHTSPLSPLFDELRERTFAELSAPQMQVGLLEGRFLSLLVAISQAKRILEFGTFSGFSTLAMASALPTDGKIVTCDVDPKATTIAKEFWSKSPHGNKIELRLGNGVDTAKSLITEGQSFDLIFVDADKANYSNYWNLGMDLLKVGGLLIVDNTLWSGRVLNPTEKSDFAIDECNQLASKDPRAETILLPLRDGVFLARKIK